MDSFSQMSCCAWVLATDARLLEVIICWVVFVSLLIVHLKNTEQEHMDRSSLKWVKLSA